MFWVPLNALYQPAGVRRKQDSLGLIIIVKAKSSVLGGLVIEDQQQTSTDLFSVPRLDCLIQTSDLYNTEDTFESHKNFCLDQAGTVNLISVTCQTQI